MCPSTLKCNKIRKVTRYYTQWHETSSPPPTVTIPRGQLPTCFQPFQHLQINMPRAGCADPASPAVLHRASPPPIFAPAEKPLGATSRRNRHNLEVLHELINGWGFTMAAWYVRRFSCGVLRIPIASCADLLGGSLRPALCPLPGCLRLCRLLRQYQSRFGM